MAAGESGVLVETHAVGVRPIDLEVLRLVCWSVFCHRFVVWGGKNEEKKNGLFHDRVEKKSDPNAHRQ